MRASGFGAVRVRLPTAFHGGSFMHAFSEVRVAAKNHLLAAMARQFGQLLMRCEPCDLTPNQTVYGPGEPMHHVYFPEEGVVSLVAALSDGTTVEVGMVGCEGMLGVPLLLGVTDMPHCAVVQVGGRAWRMRAEVFREEVQRQHSLCAGLLRYTQALLVQTAQVAACNRLHTVEERLCRWLLMVHDRLESDDFLLTHEVIAKMLGSRRAGVTVAAGLLQRAGIISYLRGHIHILDRRRLESTACECYYTIKSEFDRLATKKHLCA